MTAKNKRAPWVRLGDYIEEVVVRVGEKTNITISGININEGFIPTVANMMNIDIRKYKYVPKGCFACNLMHVGRDITIPIAYNSSKENIAVSPAYTVFEIRQNNQLITEYLELIFSSREFGRLAWFHTIDSIRGNLPYKVFCDIRIPLPSIEVQQELVDTYTGLKHLAEENEALIAPLTEACQAFIVDCQKKYPMVELGKYIEECDERNTEGKYTLDDVRGISIEKKLIFTKANMDGVTLEPYKLLKPLEFGYVTVTSRNGDKITLAINREKKTFLVSSSYKVFKTKSKLLPEYLYLLLSRGEFDRYARFNSWGSARETFDWTELCRVSIALPPPEVQQSIVNLYHCIEEAKKIASEARAQLQTLCPALIQYAEHN